MRTDGAVEPELCFLDCIIDLVMYQKYREYQDTNNIRLCIEGEEV